METKSCKVTGCKKGYRAKGYCWYHYKKWTQGELPKPRYKTCLQEGCRKSIFAKSFCEEHYKNWSQSRTRVLRAAEKSKKKTPTAEAAPAEATTASS